MRLETAPTRRLKTRNFLQREVYSLMLVRGICAGRGGSWVSLWHFLLTDHRKVESLLAISWNKVIDRSTQPTDLICRSSFA